MKKQIFNVMSLVLILGVSCSSHKKEDSAPVKQPEKSIEFVQEDVNQGQKLYNEKGCLVCHQLNTKLIGPSVKDIAAAYKGNKKGLTAYLKGEGKAIVEPAQGEIMKPQILITKALPDKELDAMVDYILSVK